MNLEELRATTNALADSNQAAAEMYFLMGSEEGLRVKRADVDAAAMTELCGGLKEELKARLNEDELGLVDLSTADERRNVVYKYDLDELPEELTALNDVLNTDHLPTFSFAEDDLASIKAILIVIGDGTQRLSVFKHHYPVSLLKRDGFSLRRMENSDRLVRLKGDVLKINSTFDYLSINGEVFVFKLKTLERFFAVDAAIKNMAAVGIGTIAAAGYLDSTEMLTERLAERSFARKLVRASKASPVLGVVPAEAVIAFIGTHPSLRGKIRFSADGTRIKLDTKVSQRLFLSLISDDFLQSELTHRYYASLAKDAVLAADPEAVQ